MDAMLHLSTLLLLTLGCTYLFSSFGPQVNGGLAILVNMCLYASPLSSLGHVLRTKDASSIHLPWTLTAKGCSLTWCVYGLSTGQLPVVVPHAFGLLLSSVQLLLRCCLPSDTSLQPKEEEEDLEGGMKGHIKTMRHPSAAGETEEETEEGTKRRSKTPSFLPPLLLPSPNARALPLLTRVSSPLTCSLSSADDGEGGEEEEYGYFVSPLTEECSSSIVSV